ncbi:MAG: BppU family phage baseplate upper protein [Candidatus Limnocylindria bacterium]
MATTFTFYQGNTRPFFAVQIRNNRTNGVVDLTGATVVFYFRHADGRAAKVSGATATVTDAVNGKVEYRWAAGDLDVPGIYDAEFRVTHTDAKVQTVRISGVKVIAKLG